MVKYTETRRDCTQSDTTNGYAKFRSRSHHAVIRVYDEGGNVIETHEHKRGVSKSCNDHGLRL